MRTWMLVIALAWAAVPVARGATPSQAQVAHEAAQLLEQAYPADSPGAAVLVARGDEVLFRAARGRRDVERGDALRVDDVFPIASLTKQFVAAAVLKLAEQGRLGLDEPVSTYLPDFPHGERIRIRQLLNHTAGITEYTVLPEVSAAPQDVPTTLPALLATFRERPLDFAPGERHAYSNSGYLLLGAVIEAATGRPWADVVDETVIAPLGLASTGDGEVPRLAARRPKSYLPDMGAYVPSTPYALSQAQSSGGMVSTVDDLHRWTQALHGGRVLAAADYTRMVTPEPPAGTPAQGYGYGLERSTLRGRARLGHSGWVTGYLAELLHLPDEAITVVVLENSDARGPLGDAPVIARRLAAIALGQPFPVPGAAVADGVRLDDYAGVYRSGEKTHLVRVVDGALTLQPQGGVRRTIGPVAEDEFARGDALLGVRFERGADGRVNALRLVDDGEAAGASIPRVPDPLPAEPVSVPLPQDALERLVGLYRGGGQTLRIARSGEGLQAGMIGQPSFAVIAESPTRFSAPAVGAAFEFADGAPAPSLVLRQHGMEFGFMRVE